MKKNCLKLYNKSIVCGITENTLISNKTVLFGADYIDFYLFS